ncbi:PilX N-terminal domain-containing pilus assembly protein [Psychrobacter sp.]|uniref:PilX N-terminal domain-containing pilus assembly protein n=1 Tax=Psychrobacter sp. TaxID=56811 RepID=UPI002648075C|nr:PilX N-terminal domain-containing pilus assembly protein [Psychrobacter sp.]MDN6274964.1 pilus assembly protein PilX [Psychrobacter sp.]MDN6308247.1 pilus assembly protein PilX [Psychrobacter sp.]
MFDDQQYSYPKMQSPAAQQGAVLIVVLLFLVLIILGGVMAVRNSTTDLRLATSDQINTLLVQSADNANQNIEQTMNGDSSTDIYKEMTGSGGPFGYFMTSLGNINDEYIFCFRPRGQFFNIRQTTITVPGGGNILGSDNGYCNPSEPDDYVSQRGASMTQVNIGLTPPSPDVEVFSQYTIGQDGSSSSSQAYLFDINSSAILPSYAGAEDAAKNCLAMTSKYDSVVDKEETLAGCMAEAGVPSKVLYEMANVENQSQRTKCSELGKGSGKTTEMLCSLIPD